MNDERKLIKFNASTGFSVVLEFGLNAYCVGDSISLSSRYVVNWSFIIVSSSFASIGSSDIGL